VFPWLKKMGKGGPSEKRDERVGVTTGLGKFRSYGRLIVKSDIPGAGEERGYRAHGEHCSKKGEIGQKNMQCNRK